MSHATSYFQTVPAKHRETVLAIRDLVFDCHPDAVETTKWNHPSYAVDGEDRFYIAYYTDHVDLGFYDGASLDGADPEGLLTGTGKHMRHVKFASADDVRDPAVRDLVAAVRAH
ncbi:DUF1801 domain-containing protein [Halobium salinum]|uniref:DUF1801 domain-containing protein n=1 Tax=Halobium salinum TaxID=1364940 RepID=A0ABD5PF55_9EURY|nr:DUF1801 domain-containing protein [Halobium salinum]